MSKYKQATIPYEVKFASFIQMLADFMAARTNDPENAPRLVLVPHPQTLGDTYDEMVESLNRIADAGVPFAIMPRGLQSGNKPRVLR